MLCLPTVVYLSLNDDIIANHGYVVISDIGSTDDTALIILTVLLLRITMLILEETGLDQMGLELMVLLFQDSGELEVL